VNTQEYGRRPYGVGFLVVGQDKNGPHLYEFQPTGNSYEYYAMSIGARSQSAKTYLEKHYESFTDGGLASLCSFVDDSPQPPASIEELIKHGLHALRETLQQDKELNVNNTSIGILGPLSQFEEKAVAGGSFRILENAAVEPFLKTMVPKEGTTTIVVPAQGGGDAGDADVQMTG
jgi:20S proteasome subunit alpha 6